MKSKSTTTRLGSILIVALVVPLLTSSVSAQDYEKKTLDVTTDSQEAERHFWQGMDDVNNVFFARATRHFAAAVEADPNFALAQFMHDRFVPGLTRSVRGEKLDATLGDIAKTSTAELLLASGVREQWAGNTANARALYGATAELVSDDPYVAYYHANVVGSGGSAERIAALREVTERFPAKSGGAYNTLAYALWGAGDEAGAREAVAKYMELEPNHPNPYDSYAEIFQFSGMYGVALKNYRKAIALDDTYFAGYTGVSEALLLSGDAEGARKALAEARSHASTDGARANLKRSEANTYFAEGNGKKGLSTLKEAVAALAATNSTGNTAQAHRELAVAEALFGDKNAIAGHVARASELQEGNPGNHAWAAIAYGLAGNLDAARTETRAFDKATAGSNFTKTLDGWVQLAAGDHAAAEATLIASGLDDPWAMAFMARCQKEMGNTAEAVNLERQILADNGFTSNNFGYSLSRLTLVDHGTGHIRAGLE